nr:hypothetical protein [Tanacetum cinerariifolium]
MDTSIDQQVAMDEALVPHAKRLRIGRSNFCLLLDIKSKESTLQLVYDVLRLCLFFKDFLVTADVPQIYMQELWATATIHHHAIRFKMDNKKHIVEHKDHKKSNEMYYPRFTKVIIHHFMSKDPSILRRNKVNWHYVRDDHMFSTIKLVSRYQNTQQFGALPPIELTNEEIRNSNAYKEYYVVYTGATPPKPKASVWKTQSSSDTTITPPTAAAGVLDVPTDESEEELSWNSTEDKGDDEGKDGDDSEEGDGNDDDEDDDGEEEYDEETRDEESFDHISKTPKNSDDEGNGEEDLGLNVGREEGHDEKEDEDELYKDVNINQGRGIQATLEVEDSHVTLTLVNPDGMESIFETTSQMDAQTPTLVAPLPMTAPTMTPSTSATTTTTSQAPIPHTTASTSLIQDLPNFWLTSDKLYEEAQKENDEFLKTIDENMQKIIKEQVKEQAKTSYAIAADLSEMELKKILIEKMEGNKFIQRSDEQRNLYKVLVEAYESNKIILDTYRETVTLKRRRDDDADKDEEPFAGPDWGSKRRREGQKLESASAPMKTATKSAGRSTQGSQSRQTLASESAFAKEPMQTTFQRKSPHIQSLTQVDTLTPKLLAGPTYELMKGSCKSLVELEYHLEEVFKATIDQLDWVNPEGQQYPHNFLKPIPLIPNNRGRRIIPFEHFINNDLEYLHGVKERLAFNVSLRMFTRSIVIQRRVEDLQLGVKSYQKKLNLTKPDTYRSDLKHKEAYIAYSNPRGFIYQNKDKKNRLMRIDELHKFSDGTLIDVRTALDDCLKGIRMQYFPQSIWRKSDKDRAAAMIQAIDKRLKTRRIMRSLERSILMDLQVTLTKPGRMTKPYSSHCFIANYFNVGNIKMEVKEMNSILEDSVDEDNLANLNNNLFDTIPEMFTDEHALDYSSPPLYDDVDDDLDEIESDDDNVFDYPFDSKEDKIKESKLLIDELDLPRSSDFLLDTTSSITAP